MESDEMSYRTYQRVVLARRDSRKEAEAIAEWYSTPVGERKPVGEYAVEFTNVANHLENWRVIHILPVPDDQPDVHPNCRYLIKMSQGQIKDGYDD